MPRFPGTMNGARAKVRQPPPTIPPEVVAQIAQSIRMQVPWPPMQLASSDGPPTCRADVEQWLAKVRQDFIDNKVPFEHFVWAVHEDPSGRLKVYLFNDGCIPYSPRNAWCVRPLSENPPSDDVWEVKFVQLAPPAAVDLEPEEVEG